ncbi:hypothetical protein Emag_005147 [Eimeria magna]
MPASTLAYTPVPAQFAADQPLAASVAFAPTQESVHDANECCFSESTKKEVVKSRRVHFSAKTWGPIVLSLLLVALLAPLCYNSKTRSVEKGVESRRLAGGEDSDDEELSEFAYLEDLCASLGSWTPSEGLPEGPRTSPALVDEVLATLEEGLAESPSLDISGDSGHAPVYHAVSGFERSSPASTFEGPSPFGGDQWLDVGWSALGGGASVGGYLMPTEARLDAPALQREELGRKRHRPGGVEEEEPCSSWKTPRLDLSSGERFARPLEAPQHPNLEAPPQAASSDLSQFQVLPTEDLPQEAPPSEAPVAAHHPPTPSSSAPVNSFQAQPAAATSKIRWTFPTDAEKKHPYVRIPSMLPDVVPTPVNLKAMFSSRGPQRHTFFLREAHEILVNKPVLLQQDAQYLVQLAELLANHMYNTMSKEITRESPYKVTSLLGRRFLIYDVLYSASAALNLDWPQQAWWKTLAEKVATEVDVRDYGKHSNPFYLQLIDDMVKALRLFKSGVRPSEEMIIGIKRRLFCGKYTTYFMRASCWDDWREDDKNS